MENEKMTATLRGDLELSVHERQYQNLTFRSGDLVRITKENFGGRSIYRVRFLRCGNRQNLIDPPSFIGINDSFTIRSVYAKPTRKYPETEFFSEPFIFYVTHDIKKFLSLICSISKLSLQYATHNEGGGFERDLEIETRDGEFFLRFAAVEKENNKT